MREQLAKFSRGHDLAKAFNYILKRWASFSLFLEEGQGCLSSNAAERGLRGVALGRKAWLFCGSDRGGRRAAAMYSLIVTAKMNGVRKLGSPTSSLVYSPAELVGLTGPSAHPIQSACGLRRMRSFRPAHSPPFTEQAWKVTWRERSVDIGSTAAMAIRVTFVDGATRAVRSAARLKVRSVMLGGGRAARLNDRNHLSAVGSHHRSTLSEPMQYATAEMLGTPYER